MANGRANRRGIPIGSPDITLNPNLPFSNRSNAAFIFFNKLLSRSDIRRFIFNAWAADALSASSPTPVASPESPLRTAFNVSVLPSVNSCFWAIKI